MKKIALIVMFITPVVWAQPKPLMVIPGKPVFSSEFDSTEDVDKASVKFNKETQYEVSDGFLHAIPPLVAFEGSGRESKWADSSFSRVNFPDLPKDYICQFRWQYKEPQNTKTRKRSLVYFDLGHRCIRTTLSSDGVTLLLETIWWARMIPPHQNSSNKAID